MILAADVVLIIIYSLYIKKLIKLIQSKEYSGTKYFEHLKNHIADTFFRLLVQFILLTIIYIGIKLYVNIDVVVTVFFVSTFLLINLIIIFIDSQKEQKLKYTNKIKIIYMSNVVLVTIILLILTFVLKIESLLKITYIGSLIMVFSPILTLLGHLIVKPKQNSIDIANSKQASNKVKAFAKLIKIMVITEENNTEVGTALKTMLEEKYKVLSILVKDTDLQLVETLTQNLKKEHDILIVNINNNKQLIEKVSNMIRPNYALLALNEKTDYRDIAVQLLEEISATGKIALSRDKSENCKIIKSNSKNVLSYGINEKKDLFACGNNIELQECQTAFDLRIGKEEIECITRIKGETNIAYLVGASTIANTLRSGY